MKKYSCPKTGKEDVYPRCTTIIDDCTNKGGALTQWAANMVVKWIRENCESVPRIDKGLDDWLYVHSSHLNDARFNFREVSQKALDVGSEVHGMIEHHLKTGMELEAKTDEAHNAFGAFLNWADENDLKPIQIEQKVYGKNWAGTLDFYGYFNDKLYVIDWKSSKAHYPEMRYQVAAYRSAMEKQAKINTDHNIADSCGTTSVPVETWLTEFQRLNPQGCGVLRLDKETGLPDFKDHSKTYEQDLKIFNRMVDLYYERHPRIRKQFEEATK